MAGSLLGTPLNQSLFCLGRGRTTIKDKVTCPGGWEFGDPEKKDVEAGAVRVISPSGEGAMPCGEEASGGDFMRQLLLLTDTRTGRGPSVASMDGRLGAHVSVTQGNSAAKRL